VEINFLDNLRKKLGANEQLPEKELVEEMS